MRLVDELDQRKFGSVAGADARFRDARVAAGSAFEAGRDLFDELLHHRGFGDELGELPASGQISGHRRRNEPLGYAANLLGLRRGRLDLFVFEERGGEIAEQRFSMAIRPGEPLVCDRVWHNVSRYAWRSESPLSARTCLISSSDFLPKLRIFMISSSVRSRSSETFEMPARLRQLNERTDRLSVSTGMSHSFGGVSGRGSERFVNETKRSSSSCMMVAALESASSGVIEPFVSTSTVRRS